MQWKQASKHEFDHFQALWSSNFPVSKVGPVAHFTSEQSSIYASMEYYKDHPFNKIRTAAGWESVGFLKLFGFHGFLKTIFWENVVDAFLEVPDRKEGINLGSTCDQVLDVKFPVGYSSLFGYMSELKFSIKLSLNCFLRNGWNATILGRRKCCKTHLTFLHFQVCKTENQQFGQNMIFKWLKTRFWKHSSDLKIESVK
jgi:hypothetical protein